MRTDLAFTEKTTEVWCDFAEKFANTNFDGASYFCQYCGSTEHTTTPVATVIAYKVTLDQFFSGEWVTLVARGLSETQAKDFATVHRLTGSRNVTVTPDTD